MNCVDLKTSLLGWFGSEFECRSSGDDSLIATLPLLKPNGDPIEIAIESVGDSQWRVSDLGDTHSTLYLAGVDLNDEYVRGEEFLQIVAAHKINDQDEELFFESSTTDLPERIFDFVNGLQSMLALQLTMKPKQEGRDFASVVAKFLAEQHTSFEIPPEEIEGKSGRWRFSFSLNHVRPKETLVKALSTNAPRDAMRLAEQSVFEILDVRAVRDFDAAIVTDDEGSRSDVWTPPVLRIFEEWNIQALPFVGRREKLMELARKYAA